MPELWILRKRVELIRINLMLVLFLFASLQPSRLVLAQTEEFCTGVHLDVAIPLNDLGSREYVRMDGTQTGYYGGLYPSGMNERPAAHDARGLEEAARIVPLDPMGDPDPVDGKVVLISIGMSNASMEFREFMNLAQDFSNRNSALIIENGAQAGEVAQNWADPNGSPWTVLAARLDHVDVTAAQVQIAWIKEVRTGGGVFPDKAFQLEADLLAIVQNLKAKYPNVRLAYFSSRTRSYTYDYGLSPEPAAYESGFAVKWLIERQIEGDPALNFDPESGSVLAPWLAWGPYIWADGMNPRSDGLIWTAQDLVPDCTHPSTSGVRKVANMLLDFFSTDATTQSWFLEQLPVPEYHVFLPLVNTGD